MSAGRINGLGANVPNAVSFRGRDNEYENPVSRSTERNLAILGSVAGSTALGAVAAGFTHYCFVDTSKIAKGVGFFKRNKIALLVGAAAAAVTLLVTLPSKLYNTKVNAFTKQKEMDVFSRDRSLKSNLTEQVDTEVQNPDVSLDKKLDDNLKLQMANRGTTLGIANITS